MVRDLFDPPETDTRSQQPQEAVLSVEERLLLARIRLARMQSLGLRDDAGE